MELNIGKEITALQRMTVGQLRTRYAEVFGEATRAGNKAWLVKRIAWRLQSLSEGDLSERARQRAAELANDADIRIIAPKIKTLATPQFAANANSHDRLLLAGSIITRQYKGELLQVHVLSRGFEYAGDRYKSLSAVAKAITGQHCNGYHFFRLRKEIA